MTSRTRIAAVISVFALVATGRAQVHANYESSQVQPLAVSADGLRLFAVNTPDAKLAVFSLADPRRPVLLREVAVAIEPVTVRVRNAREVWVVHQLSDAVSVVDVVDGVVIDTIVAEDEPMDVAFAQGKAFLSVAGSRLVRVYDAATRQPLVDVPVFGQDPAAILASDDRQRVWVASMRSGNRTTVVPEELAPPPPPPTNPRLPAPPQTSLIVSSEDPTWRPVINVDLPDYDVFEIDVASNSVVRRFTGVGTILFHLAQRPGTSELWVANTEARNLVRFVGNLRGHVADHRVTRIDTAAPNSVTPIDLNPGVDYSVLPNPGALATAIAQPTGLAFAPGGQELFVAAFGSDRIAVLDAAGQVQARIEVGPATGTQVDPRNKRGPRGLAHHPTSPTLYVLNRLRNQVAVIDTAARTVVRELAMFDPSDPLVASARGFLYDAKLSGNGTVSCATCHIDGGIDDLAWDLGDPGGEMGAAYDSVFNVTYAAHPMKGPMRTQTLRGLNIVSPYHWRGERATLQDFNEAFDSVLGGVPISAAEMADFDYFLQAIRHPPNPNLNLDRSLPTQPAGTSAADGVVLYAQKNFNGFSKCVDCHAVNKMIIPGSFFGESQFFNIPALRNSYKHVGRRLEPQGRVSGFGFSHDGSIDTVVELLGNPFFGPLANDPTGKLALEAFVMCVDTGEAPIVGYPRTVNAGNVDDPQVVADLNLMIGQFGLGYCDVIAKGTSDQVAVGYAYAGGAFTPDRQSQPPATLTQLRDRIRQGRAALTFMAVPRASGIRMGIDRDRDGVLDGDEGLTTYGLSSPGCSGALELLANGEPRVAAAQFAVSANDAPPGTVGLLLVGTPASVPVLGIEVLVQPLLFTPMPVDARGTALAPLPIPAQPELLGQLANLQAVFASPCGSQGLSSTQGLLLAVQP